MEQIAFIVGNTYIYWNTVITILASLAAIFTFLALWIPERRKFAAVILMIPLAMILSVLLSRLTCWYFRREGSLDWKTMTDILLPGRMALLGAFAGCFLTALLIRIIHLTDNLPKLLDALCLAGGVGVALGRLAAFFGISDRGMIMPAYLGLPWACVISNPVTGAQEHRLATFLLQAIAVGIITLVLLVFYLSRKDIYRDGDTAMLFLLCYGASQVLLDSTRYDSLYFRSNGFVSVVQVLSAVAIVLAVVVFAARMVGAGGWKNWYPAIWVSQLACIGLAGYMEYHVQRHGDEALFAYSVMGAALAMVIILTLVSRRLTIRMEAKWNQRLSEIWNTEGEGLGVPKNDGQ